MQVTLPGTELDRSTRTPDIGKGLRGALTLARREPTVAICLLLLAGLIVCVLIPGAIAPYDPLNGVMSEVRQPPSRVHLFGTDGLGRDIFSRVVFGARPSIGVALLATLVGCLLGGTIGLVSGYFSGPTDAVLMRLMDVMLAFPGILLAMAIIAARGRGIENLMLAIGLASIPEYARLVRGQVLSVRRNAYVEASLSAGAGPARLMFQHILPNVLSPITVLSTIGIGFALLAASSLSFIGLGAQPPSPEWGAMLSDGRAYMRAAWWVATFPGLAIFITVVCVNVVGEWMRAKFGGGRRG